MTVPDYQSLMLPLLKVLGDGEEHSLHEVIETLADQFELTEEEKRSTSDAIVFTSPMKARVFCEQET